MVGKSRCRLTGWPCKIEPILLALACVLSASVALAQAEPFIPLDRDNYISTLAQRATRDQLFAGRYNPVAGTPSTLANELWLFRYCSLIVIGNGYFPTRDWCMAVTDALGRGWRFADLVSEGLPPRMPPSPEPFPALDYTGCPEFYYEAPSWFATEFPCHGHHRYESSITPEERATSEAQLRGFTSLVLNGIVHTDIFRADVIDQYLDRDPMIRHLYNMWNVQIWGIPTRLDRLDCETCLLPVEGSIPGGYVVVQRAWAQPANDQVYFIFYYVIIQRDPGTITHHFVRFGAPVSIWGQADILAGAYAQRILAAHGVVQAESFIVQLYRATMFGDTFLKFYDRCRFNSEWSPDWRLAKDLTIDTLSYVALIGSFGCGAPARVALVVDSGFLVYETYDLICHPSWHTGLKAGFRLLGVAGAGYYQFLQARLPARLADTANHIKPPNTIQTGCKPANYDEFITNQVNNLTYNMRGGNNIDDLVDGVRKMMQESQLDRVNVVDKAMLTGGRWGESLHGPVNRDLFFNPAFFGEHQRLRQTLIEIQDDILRYGREVRPGVWESTVLGHGDRPIATKIFDTDTGRVTIRIDPDFGAQFAREFPRPLGDILHTSRERAEHIGFLAYDSFQFSYAKVLQEGNAMYKNITFDTVATFINGGQKVTFDELLFLQPFKYSHWEEYAEAFARLFP